MRTAIRFAVMAAILLSGAAFAGEPDRARGKNGGFHRQRRIEESRAHRYGGAGWRKDRRPGGGVVHSRPRHDRDAARTLKNYFKYVATPEENARINALRAYHSRRQMWVPRY